MTRSEPPPSQHRLGSEGERLALGLDTAYLVDPSNRGLDVLVIASHCGVVPARVVCAHRPRATVMVDCGIGLHGSGIAGLPYFEGAGIPAAAAAVESVYLGDSRQMHDEGVIRWCNALASQVGIEPGTSVREGTRLLLEHDADPNRTAAEKATRTIVHRSASGRAVVCVDSVAFADASDTDNVICIGGHAGPAAYDYVAQLRPHGIIGTDGGIGKDWSGLVGLELADSDGIAWAAVDVRTARLGDGYSTWRDGTVAHVNRTAEARGVRVGMPASEAAALLAGD